MSDQLTDLKHDDTVSHFLLFSGVTLIAVALVARWGEQGFLASLHEAAFIRSLKYVDWLDVSIHYVPLAVCNYKILIGHVGRHLKISGY
jgi:hypothetical protein